MPSTIITKNSSTAAGVPLAANLVKGELAVNVTDKKLYTKDNSSAVVKLVGSLGNQEANAVAITGGSITGMASPTGSTDVANKGYVDSLISSNSANAAAAAASASAASTSASNASTSASAASTSASNASTSATNASNAQTAAEAARDQTLASFDNFDDRYLGTKATDPTLDNDGNALAAGSLYFNSTSGIMKVYTGSAWVAAYVSAEGFATLVGTETLTNKTINGSNNTLTNVSLTTAVTGTLGVANGGTGRATLTANNIILGNGTSTVNFVAPGSNGNVLTSNGTTWTSAAPSAALPAAGGVGAYALMRNSVGSSAAFNTSVAGSTLWFSGGIQAGGAFWGEQSVAASGTWRVMSGPVTGGDVGSGDRGLFLRIA
jgi:hypothetical protein